MSEKRVLITGAAGYVGHQLGSLLAQDMYVIGVDIAVREAPFEILKLDVCDPSLASLLQAHKITHVVHLASVVAPSRDRERDYRIDVDGTRNVLEACLASGVGHVTVTSSGAAYGYYPDNPAWLEESHPLRGNPEFFYSDHKRLVEEMLQDYRGRHPELKQLVFRPCSVLGKNTRSTISNLFSGKAILDPAGANSPFVFIWDQDVINAIKFGVENDGEGEYNLAGDGALTPDQIGRILSKPVRKPPIWLIKLAMGFRYLLGKSDVKPDQIIFLQYRPVLLNTQLKEKLGYVPAKSSEEVLRYFAEENLGIEPAGMEAA